MSDLVQGLALRQQCPGRHRGEMELRFGGSLRNLMLHNYSHRISPKLTQERALEQQANHRARLIEGLAAAIREKGLGATRVADIVRHARASRETFYQCFADRDACFVALAESTFNDVLVSVVEAIDGDAPWESQVDQGIDAFLARLDADREVSVTFANDLPMLGAIGAEVRAKRNEQYAQLFVALANSPAVVAEIGDVSYITMGRATFLVAGIDGVIERAVRAGADLAPLAPELKDLVRRVLAPNPNF